MKNYQEMIAGPAIFQLGIPAVEGMPEKFFAHVRSSNLLKTESFSSLVYPDSRGEFDLRQEIAGYLCAWFATPSSAVRGLCLALSRHPERIVAKFCRQLFEIIDRHC